MSPGPEKELAQAHALIAELRERCALSERALEDERRGGAASERLVKAWREASELRALLDARPDIRELERLRSRNGELVAAVREVDAAVAQWRTATVAERERLEAAFVDAVAERERLEAAFVDARAERERIDAELSDAHAEGSALRDALERSEAGKAFARTMLREAKRRAAQPPAAPPEPSRRVRRAAVKELKADRAALRREIDELMGRLDAVVEQLTHSEESRAALAGEVERRRAVEADLRALLASERAKAERARTAAGTLRDRLVELPADAGEEWSALEHELLKRLEAAKTLAPLTA